MHPNEVTYHYHNDKLFEKMISRLAWRMMELDDLSEIESGVYSYDLVVRWYDILNEQPKDDSGVPITIDMLPMGVFAHQVIQDVFPELGVIKQAAIAQAWYELRDAMFKHFVDLFTGESDVTDEDLVFSLAQFMHLVPDDELHENPRVSLRLFSNLNTALNYGRA